MEPANQIPNKGKRSETRLIYFFVFISTICHATVFAALLLIPDLTPAKKISFPVVNVRLVSLPAQAPVVQAVQQQEAKSKKEAVIPKSKTKKKAPVAMPENKNQKKISTKKATKKTKKRPKQSLKHKTFKSSKVLESTLSRLKKEVDESRPPSLEKAFDQLEKKVKESDQPPPTQRSAPRTIPEGSGAAMVGGQEIRNRIQIYNAEIAYQIRKNWAFSEQLAGDSKDLETALGITILPDGRIEKIWFDQKSGNRYLDESAYRAIMKSNPLPPLPQGTFDTSYTVGFRFGPKGMK